MYRFLNRYIGFFKTGWGVFHPVAQQEQELKPYTLTEYRFGMFQKFEWFVGIALLDKFFSYIGVWPIGSIIVLTDGSMAVVRDVHEDAIALPVVEVVKPERKEKLVDLKECQDTLKIERFVNPWKEALASPLGILWEE